MKVTGRVPQRPSHVNPVEKESARIVGAAIWRLHAAETYRVNTGGGHQVKFLRQSEIEDRTESLHDLVRGSHSRGRGKEIRQKCGGPQGLPEMKCFLECTTTMATKTAHLLDVYCL